MRRISLWIISGICLAFAIAVVLYQNRSKPAIATRPELVFNQDTLNRFLSGVQDGDLLLRAGNDITSNMLRQLNLRDQRFSHCGIVLKDSGRLWVYHSIGSEQYPDQPIKKEPVTIFCNPQNNIAIGYARLQMDTLSLQRLHHILDRFYQERIPFDLKFDLRTDDRMYCTEMVAKAILYSMPQFPIHPTDTLGKQYWSVDNITGSPGVCFIRYLPLK